MLEIILIIMGVIGLAISIAGFLIPNDSTTIGMLSIVMISSAIILGSGTIAYAVSRKRR